MRNTDIRFVAVYKSQSTTLSTKHKHKFKIEDLVTLLDT